MTPTPNWWPKLREAAEANGVPLEEAVSVAEVRHDDDCARLEGTGVCDCEPDVRLLSRPIDRDARRER